MNPCQLVRATCAEYYQLSQIIEKYELSEEEDADVVVNRVFRIENDSGRCLVEQQQKQPYVTINQDAIRILASEILHAQQQKHLHLQQTKPSNQQLVEWDEENWHYNIVPKTTTTTTTTTTIASSSTTIAVTPSSNTTSSLVVSETEPISTIIDTNSWSIDVRMERTAAFILALDAINFCFWTTTTTNESDSEQQKQHNQFEYEHLAQAMKHMACSDHMEQQKQPNHVSWDTFTFSPSNLECMTTETMEQLFEQYGVPIETTSNNNDPKVTKTKKMVPPDMKIRVQMWKHIGSVLRKLQQTEDTTNNNKTVHNVDKSNTVLNLIKKANGSAPELVRILIEYFPQCFGVDHVVLDNNSERYKHIGTIHFYKRAQICVGDLNSALQLQLHNMNELTMFADYRVPQILQYKNVLVYSSILKQTLTSYTEIQPNHPMELSIRAATVTAVEWLVQELNNQQDKTAAATSTTASSTSSRHAATTCTDSTSTCTTNKEGYETWNPVLTDWYLWQLGERMVKEQPTALLPHHRVRTTNY